MLTENKKKIFLKITSRLVSGVVIDDPMNMRGGMTLASLRPGRNIDEQLHLTQEANGYTIRYSIALHVGELRIGVVVPQEMMILLPFNTTEFAERMQAYPAYGKDGFPYIMTRSLGHEGGWYDFIYPTRYNQLTEKALSGDGEAQSLLADSMVHELMCISHAFELLISRYLMPGSVSRADISYYEKQNFSIIRFWSLKNRDDLIREYGIDYVRLAIVKEPSPPDVYGEYMLLIPPEGPEREAVESLWSMIATGEFIVDPNKNPPGKLD